MADVAERSGIVERSQESSPKGVEVLQRIVQATNGIVGRNYFRALVQSLAQVLEVQYCFITECLETAPNRVGTLAFWAGNEFAPKFQYSILETPCESVVLEGKSCVFGVDIQRVFPNDQDLVDLDAESYAAAPLVGSSDTVIGHLVVIDVDPFVDPPDVALLEFFAARAAAELERQRATAELAKSEARLRQVVDLVPHYIFAKDREGRFLLVNQAVADTYGIRVEEVIGKRDADFTATREEVERFRRDDLEVLESGQVKVIDEESVTDAQGRKHLLQTTKIPTRFGGSGEPVILGVSINITEKRRAEMALRAIVEGTADTVGEAFYRSVTKHLAKALDVHCALVAEFDGIGVRSRALWAGGAFLDTLEYEIDGAPCEHLAKTCMDTFYPRDLRGIFPGKPLLEELGAESYLGSPLLDAKGQAVGLLAVLDRRPMDDNIQHSQLMSIFASRAAAEIERERLEEHRSKLQAQVLHVQKLESLGVLAGGIAHDFNNLLSAIVGNVDMARLRLSEGRLDRVDDHLGEIAKAARRSTDLTRQMLAYSGHGSLEVTRIDLNRLIEEMLELLSVSINKKAQLELGLDPQLPHLEGDATQIRQVVMNLVINASDAIGETPGTIHLRTGVLRADRTYLDGMYLSEPLPEGEYLFIEVEDDGCGMDEATLAYLFDPFFTTKDTGRGLGLAALLGIVRGHQGGVRVKSAPDEGSKFTILLPVGVGELEEVSEEFSAPEWLGAGKALLVDDERLVRIILQRMLEQLGFEVLVAEDGLQAIEIFRAAAPEIRVVVLDMMMPKLNGLETLRELRGIEPSIKVLLASGFSRQAIAMPLDKGGADAFLQKPVQLEDLRTKLYQILE